MANTTEVMQMLSLELRRGTIVLSVLSQLEKPKYGYALVQVLEEKGISVEAGTLYPLLRRLEKQGLLLSEWETGGSKPRKYYSLTPMGKEVYKELKMQWEELVCGMQELMSNRGDNNE